MRREKAIEKQIFPSSQLRFHGIGSYEVRPVSASIVKSLAKQADFIQNQWFEQNMKASTTGRRKAWPGNGGRTNPDFADSSPVFFPIPQRNPL